METTMTKTNGPLRRALACAALGVGVIAMTAADNSGAEAGWFTRDQVRCEIKVTPGPYGVQLEGLVFAKDALTGEYELSVTQDGPGAYSLVNQSGGFEAGPRQPASLGMVSLGGGASYTAKLKVRAGGDVYTCAKRIGGQA
jgi:hypothetical protein